MRAAGFMSRFRPWLLGLSMAAAIAGSSPVGHAENVSTTRPALAARSVHPAADPAGFGGATDASGIPTLTVPNRSLPGWQTGGAEDDGHGGLKSWKGYADPEKPTTKELSQNLSKAFYSINLVWILACAFLVMFMQAGFSLIDTGLTRAKNAAHTVAMNFMVSALGMFGFFICGFAFMCGGVNGTSIGGPGQLGGLPTLHQMLTIGGWGVLGGTGYFLSGISYDGMAIAWFVFMAVFMATAAAIPTGALAERWNFKSFFIFSICVGALIYPVYGCWVWGGGWLAQLGSTAHLGHGLVDYAGSSVVHLQGGALALITSLLLGPRLGKFGRDGRPRPILGHSMPMVMLGTFILAFGWFGLSAGSSLAGTDGRIGIVVANTMIAGMSATIFGVLYMWIRYGKPDPSIMCNSMLAGLVAITAPCAFVTPVSAFIIGAVAGVLVVVSIFFWDGRKIDDPVGAISVHGVNGAWGMIALGLFADGTSGVGLNTVGYNTYMGAAGKGVTGLFYGDASQLWAQIIGVLVCIAWNVIIGGLIFWIIGRILGSNRVPVEVELAGLDISEMGASGYPEFINAVTPESISPADIAAAKVELGIT